MPEQEGEIYDAIERFRRQLLQRERHAASKMVRVYGEAWKRIKREYDKHNKELFEAEDEDKEALAWKLMRVGKMKQFIESELARFSVYADESIVEQQHEAIEAAEAHAHELILKSLGEVPHGITIALYQPNRSAVEKMVGMTQQDSPLHRLLAGIAPQTAEAAGNILVQGIMLGKNPRDVAVDLRRVLGEALSRALRIARTEVLRAYREATRETYRANSDIVKGWIWHSACDDHTCAACWAMHGTHHSLDERLDDHPNGRCSALPLTKSWEEIGKQYGIDLSDVPDTNPDTEPGVLRFDRLPAEKQIKILGPAKYAAWKEGEFSLSDIAGRAWSREWGTHRFEKSLMQLLGEKKAKGYTRLALMGVARNAGQYSVDDLIRLAGLGLRELTPEELERIVRHVAKAGFDPNGLEKCGGRLAGLVWNGKTLKGSDRLPPGEVHYLRHVVYGNEWPNGTTLEEYYRSLENVIRDEKSRILISKFSSEWQIGFLGENQPGMRYTYTWVEYRVSRHHWITGLQIEDLEKFLQEPKRTNVKWLR